MYHYRNSNSRIKIGKSLLIWSFILVVMTAIAVADVEQGPVEPGIEEPEPGIIEEREREEVIEQSEPVEEPGLIEEAEPEAIEEAEPEVVEQPRPELIEESEPEAIEEPVLVAKAEPEAISESFIAAEVRADGDEAGVGEDDTVPLFNFNCDEDFTVRKALAQLGQICHKNIVPSPSVDGQLAFRRLVDVTFEEAMDAILGSSFEYEQNGNLVEVFPKGDESRMKYEVFALRYITAAEAKKLVTPILSSQGVVETTTAAETGVPVGESISAQSGGGDTMSLRDTIVVYDYAENIKKAKDIVAAVDVRPKQVLVDATILSATLTEDMQFGIDWQALKGTAVADVSGIVSGTPDYLKAEGTQFGGATALNGGLTFGLALGDVGSFIRAVEQVTDVTILANPKILAVNKQLGQVFIGDKIGYLSQTTISEGGNTTQEVSFLDTGTKLSFRPYISSDGYIRMDIHAKNSKETQGDVISETSTEIASNIMVKDGGTIAIGGLFQDTIETKRTQIPVLGNFPLIGGLFRGTSDQYVRKEVIVLLTPHIIEEPEQTEGQARAEDVSRKRVGAKEELQWVGRARLAEDRYAKAAKYYIEGDNESAMRQLSIVLKLRPTYLEAIRLKERIIAETKPAEMKKLERIMLEAAQREDTAKWHMR